MSKIQNRSNSGSKCLHWSQNRTTVYIQIETLLGSDNSNMYLSLRKSQYVFNFLTDTPSPSESSTPAPGDPRNDLDPRMYLDPVMKSVYLGRCSYKDLPPLAKKVVRIFVSSTFSGKSDYRIHSNYDTCSNFSTPCFWPLNA